MEVAPHYCHLKLKTDDVMHPALPWLLGSGGLYPPLSLEESHVNDDHTRDFSACEQSELLPRAIACVCY